jgi:ABC-2 type transport system ATP-binding protein
LGCEYALSGERRLKVIMQESIEISDLYRLALQHQVQIRRLNFKRDSLEDIFLKAMENTNGQTNGRVNDGSL